MRFPPKCPNDVINKLPNPPGPPIHRPDPKPGDPDCGKDCFKNCYDNRSKIPALRPLLPLIRFHCNLHCNAVLMACANASGGGGNSGGGGGRPGGNPTLNPKPGGGGGGGGTPPTCNDTPDPNCEDKPETLLVSPARQICIPEGAILDLTIGSPVNIPFCSDNPTTPNPCTSLGSICAPLPGPPGSGPTLPPGPSPSTPSLPTITPCTPPALPKGYGQWILEGSGESQVFVRYHPDGRPILEPTADGGFAIEYPQFGRLLFDQSLCPVDPGRPTTPPKPTPTPLCKGLFEECSLDFCDDVVGFSSKCAPLSTKPDKDPQRPVLIPIGIVPQSTTALSQMGESKNSTKQNHKFSAIINHPSIDSFKSNNAPTFTASTSPKPNSNFLSDIVAKCESSGAFEFFSNNLLHNYNIVSIQDISVI